MVKDANGAHEFGTSSGDTARPVIMTVQNARMWTRIIMSHDLGCEPPQYPNLLIVLTRYLVAEAYIEGDFDVSSMKDLLNVRSSYFLSLRYATNLFDLFTQLWLDNRETLTGLTNAVSGAFSRYSALAISILGGRQGLGMARKNVVCRPSLLV